MDYLEFAEMLEKDTVVNNFKNKFHLGISQADDNCLKNFREFLCRWRHVVDEWVVWPPFLFPGGRL